MSDALAILGAVVLWIVCAVLMFREDNKGAGV